MAVVWGDRSEDDMGLNARSTVIGPLPVELKNTLRLQRGLPWYHQHHTPLSSPTLQSETCPAPGKSGVGTTGMPSKIKAVA